MDPLKAFSGTVELSWYLALARHALGETLQPGLHPSPAGNPPLDRAESAPWPGVFVTLWKKSPAPETEPALRGCIGHIEGRMPLSESVPLLVREAAFHDPRFPPLSLREFPLVHLEITLLSPPEPVNSWQDIKIGIHGMVMACQGRQAVFLPQVALEQGWDLRQTLNALSRKAGLEADAWLRPDARFRVFEGIHESE